MDNSGDQLQYGRLDWPILKENLGRTNEVLSRGALNNNKNNNRMVNSTYANVNNNVTSYDEINWNSFNDGEIEKTVAAAAEVNPEYDGQFYEEEQLNEEFNEYFSSEGNEESLQYNEDVFTEGGDFVVDLHQPNRIDDISLTAVFDVTEIEHRSRDQDFNNELMDDHLAITKDTYSPNIRRISAIKKSTRINQHHPTKPVAVVKTTTTTAAAITAVKQQPENQRQKPEQLKLRQPVSSGNRRLHQDVHNLQTSSQTSCPPSGPEPEPSFRVPPSAISSYNTSLPQDGWYADPYGEDFKSDIHFMEDFWRPDRSLLRLAFIDGWNQELEDSWISTLTNKKLQRTSNMSIKKSLEEMTDEELEDHGVLTLIIDMIKSPGKGKEGIQLLHEMNKWYPEIDLRPYLEECDAYLKRYIVWGLNYMSSIDRLREKTRKGEAGLEVATPEGELSESEIKMKKLSTKVLHCSCEMIDVLRYYWDIILEWFTESYDTPLTNPNRSEKFH